MAISGSWAERYANAQSYTGALRWGTGVNPIHSVRDNPGRVTGIKENLYPLGDASDAPPDVLIDGEFYVGSEYDGEQPYPDEDFRYQDDEPRWGTPTQDFRGATLGNPVMGEWDEWGGPTITDDTRVEVGGMDHGEAEERQHAIAVPTGGVSGGWVNKARGAIAMAEYQDPGDPGYQLAITTSGVQGEGVKSLVNDRAVGRGTDSARTPIQSRTAGMVMRSFAKSFGMGGGSGTADMQPYQQTAGLKRPFVSRHPGLPPMEDHYWNEMEQRTPIQRTPPPDPYQGAQEAADDNGDIADEGGDWYG